MNYVYSTATCGTFYCFYKNNSEKDLGIVAHKVEIKGGHGVSTPKTCITPRGVVTIVSDEDMEFLLKNDSFLKHVKKGFISYDKKEVNPEKKAKDMAEKDGSAPLTPSDFAREKIHLLKQKFTKKRSA